MFFQINDEDGFLALLNSQQYCSFVDEDWSDEQLMQHFITQMQQKNLLLWQTCDNVDGGFWNIEVIVGIEHPQYGQQFSHDIRVSQGRLDLCCYSDLTMAAQFETIHLPVAQHEQYVIPLENGLYTVTVCKCFEDGEYSFEPMDTDPHFKIYIAPQLLDGLSWINKIPWSRYY